MMCLRFSTSKKLSPRQKLLLAYLGDGYTKNRIDLENVIYRDLGDYEIEISGCHTQRQPICIYVWKKGGLRIVESHRGLVQDFERIKELLDDIVNRYNKKEDIEHE